MKKEFAALMLLTLLVRGGVLVLLGPSLQADPDGYRRLAESLAVHHLFGAVAEDGEAVATAFRPPAYPWLLSWLVRQGELADAAVAGLHLLLGMATVGLTFVLARQLFAGPVVAGEEEEPRAAECRGKRGTDDRRPLLAGILVAIDPILLVQSTQIMTETFATLLAVATWWSWRWLVAGSVSYRGRLAAGIAWALLLTAAFFCRPAFLIWGVLLVVWLLGLLCCRRDSALLIAAAMVVAILGGTIGLWTARNQRAIGHPVWATSHGGYTLLLGNNPPFYEYLRGGNWGEAWQAEPFHRAWSYRYQSDPLAEDFWQQHAAQPPRQPVSDDEVADDELAYQVAKATIRQQPSMFAWSSLVRTGRLWSPFPLRTDDRQGWRLWGIRLFYGALYVCVAWGVWVMRWRLLSSSWIAGLLLAVALTAIHAVYWSNLRMRAPAIPWLSMLAAAGLLSLPRQTRNPHQR